ncbi:MAG: hypothetical protein F4138_04570 [Acidimicrobiia bacterium]|nr:hypothetical protein [Acidimicrobiia bacterium]
MRRIVMPVVLLAIAIGTLISSNALSNQLHNDLGEMIADDTQLAKVQTPLISTRRLTNVLAPSLATPELRNTLNELMARAPAIACMSVALTERPMPIYESGTNLRLMPSEASLLATLATAYKELGPDHTFTTSIAALVEPQNGVVNGDIYLVGGGDPLLLTADYLKALPPNSNSLHTPIENLAQQLVDNGLRLVTGAVVGDASHFDDLRYVSTWPESLVQSENIGTLVGLQFDDGWVRFPDQKTTQDDPDLTQENKPAYLSAEDPSFYAAALFDDMLEARDVVIRRSPRSEALPEDEQVFVLGTIQSEPLRKYWQQILENRDVETAEILLKEIGRSATGQGTTQAGLEAVKSIFNELDIDSETQMLGLDGSGLDPANQSACPLFVALLDSSELRPLFSDLLPSMADSEPFQAKLANIADPARVKALSATKGDAAVMMGYIDIGFGQEITFVFMANQPNAQNNITLQELQADIVAYLVGLEGKPSVDDIELLPIHNG